MLNADDFPHLVFRGDEVMESGTEIARAAAYIEDFGARFEEG